jgi:hypothetical protein
LRVYSRTKPQAAIEAATAKGSGSIGAILEVLTMIFVCEKNEENENV